jgi:hypothetical protein
MLEKGESGRVVRIACVCLFRRIRVVGVEGVIARIAAGLAILPPELCPYGRPVARLPQEVRTQSGSFSPVVILLVQAGKLRARKPRI